MLNLKEDTLYVGALLSIYRGVPSEKATSTEWRTVEMKTTTTTTTTSTTTAPTTTTALIVTTPHRRSYQPATTRSSYDYEPFDNNKSLRIRPVSSAEIAPSLSSSSSSGEDGPSKTVVDIDFAINGSFVWLAWNTPEHTRCRSYRHVVSESYLSENRSLYSIRHSYDSSIERGEDIREHYVARPHYATQLRTMDVLRANVECFNNRRQFDKHWRARGVFDTKGAQPIESFRIVDVTTDAEGRATAFVSVQWPSAHDARNFDVVITYGSETVRK